MQVRAAGSHPPKEQVRARARMRFSARFMRQNPHGDVYEVSRCCEPISSDIGSMPS